MMTPQQKAQAYSSSLALELFLAQGGTLAQWYAVAASPPVVAEPQPYAVPEALVPIIPPTEPRCDLTREETAEIAHPLSIETYLELLDPRDVPSPQARRELLDSAFVCVLGELGIAQDDASWAAFHARVDELYRMSLLSRRPVRGETVEWQIRATLVAQRAREL